MLDLVRYIIKLEFGMQFFAEPSFVPFSKRRRMMVTDPVELLRKLQTETGNFRSFCGLTVG
jgi:hypothetical protein